MSFLHQTNASSVQNGTATVPAQNIPVAVVTGGGRGIGLGITQAFVQAGYRVLVVQRSPLPDSLVALESVTGFLCDLQQHNFQLLLNFIKRHYQRLDVLINNAGIMKEQAMGELTPEAWQQMFAVNVTTPVFLAQAMQPLLQAQQGKVIHIGSIEGLAANPQHTAYCATKGAVHSMTKAMAVDLGKLGIRCNAIAPGWIKSDLSDDYINAQTDPTSAWQGLHAMHPLDRVGEPIDVGQVAVFLASDAAQFITGEVIVVDGGRTAKLPLPF